MITAMHALLYSDDPTATRAFFKDVLRLPFVSESPGAEASDWLIFRSGPSEFGVHPATGPAGESWAPAGQQQITLMCDDIHATVADLASRGAVFAGAPEDMRFGIGVVMSVPGAAEVLIYEPKHVIAHDLEEAAP